MIDTFLPWGEAERSIYRFNDGTEERAVDPMTTLRKLQTMPGLALETDLTLASVVESGGKMAEEGEAAIVRLVDGARKAFNIPELKVIDGKVVGLTESECLSLLIHFGRYVSRIRESAVPLASGPPPTEVVASETSSTKPSLDSGSTAIVSPSNEHLK